MRVKSYPTVVAPVELESDDADAVSFVRRYAISCSNELDLW